MSAENTAIRRARAGYFLDPAGKNSRSALLSRMFSHVLVAMMAATSSSDLCQGWSMSAAERAACCERMANACTRWTADTCCQQGEQRQNRELTPSAPQAPRDVTAGPLVVPFDAVTYAEPSAVAPGQRPSPHLLYEVFLI